MRACACVVGVLLVTTRLDPLSLVQSPAETCSQKQIRRSRQIGYKNSLLPAVSTNATYVHTRVRPLARACLNANLVPRVIYVFHSKQTPNCLQILL